MSSKRKKNDEDVSDVSDVSDEESDAGKWKKKCLETGVQLKEVDKELVEVAAKNRRLEMQLKHVNDERLRSQSELSARGVIEWLERKHYFTLMPDAVKRGTQHGRWKWIFANDPTFSVELLQRNS
ncbi:unnamed protein product, partial [Mesorhabditis belari]|uniref:Uncharacterized protein n=1 Tax=Mesorhabditis belari TaxID=2138241 RepID=A0AAF3JBA0_9BILA